MEKITELEKYRQELIGFIASPTVSVDLAIIEKIKAAVELAIESIQNKKAIEKQNQHYFEGEVFLIRTMDGWGDQLLNKYLDMTKYIKENNWK